MRHAKDLHPLLRATVGFDHIMNMLDPATRLEEVPSYPPYNIEKTGSDEYRITMAVAGFLEEELSITLTDGELRIEGQKAQEDENERRFLHRGIASRAFQRSFQLADHIRVQDASLQNGLLHVQLVREIPEAMKPRQIAIQSGGDKKQKVIENEAA